MTGAALGTVSVIIPNYNYAKTLGACLASVFAQTYPPTEVIVVDDASTDGSVEIARGFGCHVIEHPINRGVSAARNTGVAASSGDILFFLDSDVALDPGALGNAVGLLREDPGCGCVHGVYDKQPLVDDGPVEHYRTLHQHASLMRGVGLTSTVVFALAALPRSVFDEVGGFDENLRSAEDDEYSDRLGARYRIRLTDRVRGRHDEEDRLLPMLREQFQRAQLLRFAARHRFSQGALKFNRMPSVLTAAAAVGLLPPGLLWPPALVAAAMAALLFAASDPHLFRFVLRERGPAFLAFFTAVHFLVNVAIVAGAGTGFLRAWVDPTFGPTHRRVQRRPSPAKGGMR